jgi:CheY-like chemotaxis protein
VLADRGQLEHILMNLAVNAQDAMPSGGALAVRVARAVLDDPAHSAELGIPLGGYAQLVVTDTGEGMTREVRERAFEPFYTTKGPGEGTGLGLSTVFGIVRQHRGAVSLVSEPGSGARFTIHLPLTSEVGLHSDDLPQSEVTLDRDIRVMVVEDDPVVRDLVVEILEDSGCSVQSAGSCDECLNRLAEGGSSVQLLLTDVIMPDGDGRNLARDIRIRRPEMGFKVLFMSGYADNVIGNGGELDPRVNFIQKPFTINALLNKIKTVLEA